MNSQHSDLNEKEKMVITWKLNFATCLSFCGNRSRVSYVKI